MASALEQNTRHQIIFREVNEHIAELTRLASETDVNLFICECSDPACAESLEITTVEYEQVRANGARFVVVPGHELLEIERVVDGTARFLVVEKLGAAGSMASDFDPRDRG